MGFDRNCCITCFVTFPVKYFFYFSRPSHAAIFINNIKIIAINLCNLYFSLIITFFDVIVIKVGYSLS